MFNTTLGQQIILLTELWFAVIDSTCVDPDGHIIWWLIRMPVVRSLSAAAVLSPYSAHKMLSAECLICFKFQGDSKLVKLSSKCQTA